ncbi:MAG TPA: hypothetical protein VH969_10990 [Actinophytocola sp.]|jgi:hypothetical protein|uniref:hypothetical protein n=1 Tax=Actinophytocola sp. TaxID=1872138 RepID=UPI002F955488
MEGWRVIATVLLAVAGFVIVLLTMAKTRDRAGATSGTVALNGVIAFTALVVLCVLTLTVLPATAAWILVGLVGATVTVMLLAS